MSDALLVQTYPLPPTIDPQIVAGMARAYELRVVEQTAASIVVEGHEEELTAFADRLEQLARPVPVMAKDSSAPSPPWRQALADYLSAVATHHEAEKLYWRALRIFCKLGRRCSDSRAYELAGLGLADRRSIGAAAAKREAYTALKKALQGEPVTTVIMAWGAAACATSLPRAANEP